MWASKALGTNQRVIATICGARSGHRTADFSGDCPKIDTLAAQRGDGVMEPNTLLVGDENAPVFADSRDRNRLLTNSSLSESEVQND
jgi:hypothetical protein